MPFRYFADSGVLRTTPELLVRNAYAVNLKNDSIRKKQADSLTPGEPSPMNTWTIEPSASLHSKKWPSSFGITGRFPSEWVAAIVGIRIQDLADQIGEIKKAAAGVGLEIQVTIEVGVDTPASDEARVKIQALLEGVCEGLALE